MPRGNDDSLLHLSPRSGDPLSIPVLGRGSPFSRKRLRPVIHSIAGFVSVRGSQFPCRSFIALVIPNALDTVPGRKKCKSESTPGAATTSRHVRHDPARIQSAMASRRLLDLFALADASAAVARKHLLLRSAQLNLFAATSSIGRGTATPIRRYDPTTNTTTHAKTDARSGADAGATAKPSQDATPPSKPMPAADGNNAERFRLRPSAPPADLSSPHAKAAILPAKAAIPRTVAAEQPPAGGAGGAAGFARDVPPPRGNGELEALGQQAFQSRRARGLLAAGSPPLARAAVPPAANTSQDTQESVAAPVRRSITLPYRANLALPTQPHLSNPASPAPPNPAQPKC